MLIFLKVLEHSCNFHITLDEAKLQKNLYLSMINYADGRDQ